MKDKRDAGVFGAVAAVAATVTAGILLGARIDRLVYCHNYLCTASDRGTSKREDLGVDRITRRNLCHCRSSVGGRTGFSGKQHLSLCVHCTASPALASNVRSK